MAKGFLAGVISGGFVSAVGLALVSPMLPPVKIATAPVVPVEVPAPAMGVPEGEAPAMETEDAALVDVADGGADTNGSAPTDQAADAAPMTDSDDGSAAVETTQPEQPAVLDEGAAAPDTSQPDVTLDRQSGLGTTVAPLEDQASGVTTSRLPSIGAADPAPEAEEELAEEDAPAPKAAAPLIDLSTSPLAIERNSVPVSDTQGRPLVAVVLKDMGPERTQLEGLENLPFPVSVILDVTAPDLEDAMTFYRGAGAEVVMQADLPAGATPSDAEVNFQVQQPKLNMGVAVYMAPESGFQTNAPLSRQVAEILVVSGHGLITQPEGLNTGHKNAMKTGVPSGLVFRDLDGEGQDNKVIRRFLDNAAFKAAQEEGVILFGRAVPQTLAALVEWSVGTRASSVAMVPVSAVLLGGS